MNPWTSLPGSPPYVLAADQAALESCHRSPESLGLHLDLLPVPWIANPERASVVLLMLNPSLPSDAVQEEDAEYRSEILRNLTFESNPPYFDLNDRFLTTGGYAYWTRLLGGLIGRFGREPIAEQLTCVQYFPYRSAVYIAPPCDLPSQAFTWELVREAMRGEKVIIVQRSWKLWVQAVPELTKYHSIRLRNIRSPFISPGNMTTEE